MKQNDEVSVGKLKFVLCITKFGWWAVVLMGLLYLLETAVHYFYSACLKIRHVVEMCPREIMSCLLYFGLLVCFLRGIVLIFVGVSGWIKSVKEKRRVKKQCSSPEGLQSNDIEFSDSPIAKAQDDILCRDVYVRKLASLIEHLPKVEAGYIGIYGEWGEGKTSVRNLLEEHFKRDASKIKPLFFNFSPWEYPEKTDLRSVFFEVISEKLAHNNIRTISKIFSLLSKGFKIRRMNNELGALHECVDLIRNLFNVTFTNDDLIQCAKQELLKLDRQIVVVIDDLDRLTNEDACQVLRFLKANADLPNMVYLILADENHLGQAIQRMVRGRGREFIEKIIPFSCPLPPINKEALKNFLKMEIEKLLKAYELTFPNDEDAYESVLEYVRTPRKLKRLVNTFAIDLAGLKLQVAGRRLLNVHLGDLLVLTAVKLFEPECYRRLYSVIKQIESTAFYCDFFHNEGVEPEWLEKQLIKYVNPMRVEWFRDFLEARLGIVLKKEDSRSGNTHKYVRAHMNDARHLGEYRLASQYCFPNYFLASCEKLFLQQDDLDKFERQICRQEEPLPLLMKFDKEGKLAQLLDVLEVHEEYSDVKISKFFVKSLVQLAGKGLSPLIYSDASCLWQISIYEKILRTILFYCQKLKSPRIRGSVWSGRKIGDDLLLQVLADSDDFVIASYLIKYDAQEHNQDSATYDSLFSNEGYEKLQQIFLCKIVEMQRNNVLFNHPEFEQLFRVWLHVLSNHKDFIAESREVFKCVIEDDVALEVFLSQMVDKVWDRMDEKVRAFTFCIERLELLFDMDDIKLIAKKLQQDDVFSNKFKEAGAALEWALNEKENDQDYSFEAQRQFILNRRNGDTKSEKEE